MYLVEPAVNDYEAVDDDALVMDAGSILEQTRDYWDNHAGWEESQAGHLLFFGAWPTNDDMYAYVIKRAKGASVGEIVYFDHEMGEHWRLASNLAELFRMQMEDWAEMYGDV